MSRSVLALFLCASFCFGNPPAIIRRHAFTEDDLRQQLAAVPVVGLGPLDTLPIHAALTQQLPGAFSGNKFVTAFPLRMDFGPQYLKMLAQQTKQPWLANLPWRTASACFLSIDDARRLDLISDGFHRNPGPLRPDTLKIALSHEAAVSGEKYHHQPGAVPALAQILEAEASPIRIVFVDHLAGIQGGAASAAIARRAIFDLSPDVREKAVQALAMRPATEWLPTVLSGFGWPWAPVAEHAAETIIALQPGQARAGLVQLAKDSKPWSAELVQLNHLSNCIVCHGLTQDRNLIRLRASMPIPTRPMESYQNGADQVFVRADVTYLRQAFSVMQPVTQQTQWPKVQRFDYLLRYRKMGPAELKEAMIVQAPQRKALDDTLRHMMAAYPENK